MWNVVKPMSRHIETEHLVVKDAVLADCEALQQICSSWDDKVLLEGDPFELGYIRKCIVEGDLPPLPDASREKYAFKAIYLKQNGKVVGFLDLYHGYPAADTLWISIFVVDKSYQNRGFAHEVISSLADDAKAAHFSKMGVSVYLKNWRGLRFWTKAGFDRITRVYGDKDFGPDTFALVGLERSL